MKDKKNIDDVFKDGLKNHEASPSPQVWNDIQARMEEERSRRKVIPLWIRIGGVAALLALLLTVGNWIYDPMNSDSPAITKEDVEKMEDESIQENHDFHKIDSNQFASEAKDGIDENGDPTEIVSSKSSSEGKRPISSGKKEIVSSENSSSKRIAAENKESKVRNKTKEKYQEKSKLEERIATIKAPSKTVLKEGEAGIISSERNIHKEKNQESFNQKDIENPIAKEEAGKTNLEEEENSPIKPSLLDAIAEQEKIKDEGTKKEGHDRKWKVTPNVAPVYYSSLGNGSSIDPNFSGNAQKGDVNMSYGVQVSYALNDRLSLRTGLNNVDLSYSTGDVIIASGPVAVGLRGVDYGPGQIVVTAVNRDLANHAGTNAFGDLNLKSTAGNARVIQSINYYEVPVELQYALVDSRFGINIIGGLSTLFLGDDEISVKSDNFSSVLGSANNLSQISFSTNVGLGLNYRLSKSFVLNVEPMFKYQINPYSDSSVDFKPYYLGVYSGLSFKF